jgi:hypothetical protein
VGSMMTMSDLLPVPRYTGNSTLPKCPRESKYKSFGRHKNAPIFATLCCAAFVCPDVCTQHSCKCE